MTGIEPASSAWKAATLPLCYIRQAPGPRRARACMSPRPTSRAHQGDGTVSRCPGASSPGRLPPGGNRTHGFLTYGAHEPRRTAPTVEVRPQSPGDEPVAALSRSALATGPGTVDRQSRVVTRESNPLLDHIRLPGNQASPALGPSGHPCMPHTSHRTQHRECRAPASCLQSGPWFPPASNRHPRGLQPRALPA